MEKYTYVTLRQKPLLKETAAEWFHSKWQVPKEAYLESMDAILIIKQNTAGIFV